MPASSAPLPDPVAEKPNNFEPFAEIVIALPIPPASIIGLPTPLSVRGLVTLTLSLKVPFCTSMIWPGLAEFMADWILYPGLTENVASAKPESITTMTARITPILIPGLDPICMFIKALPQYKMMIIEKVDYLIAKNFRRVQFGEH